MKTIKKVFWILVAVLWLIVVCEAFALAFITAPLWVWFQKARDFVEEFEDRVAESEEILEDKLSQFA